MLQQTEKNPSDAVARRSEEWGEPGLMSETNIMRGLFGHLKCHAVPGT